MKSKPLYLALAALVVAAGLWLARSAWRSPAPGKADVRVLESTQRPRGFPDGAATAKSTPGTNLPSQADSVRSLAPPAPNRRFRDFTPEQRVEFARQGHGPGG